jgi:hypothetical protein
MDNMPQFDPDWGTRFSGAQVAPAAAPVNTPAAVLQAPQPVAAPPDASYKALAPVRDALAPVGAFLRSAFGGPALTPTGDMMRAAYAGASTPGGQPVAPAAPAASPLMPPTLQDGFDTVGHPNPHVALNNLAAMAHYHYGTGGTDGVNETTLHPETGEARFLRQTEGMSNRQLQLMAQMAPSRSAADSVLNDRLSLAHMEANAALARGDDPRTVHAHFADVLTKMAPQYKDPLAGLTHPEAATASGDGT